MINKYFLAKMNIPAYLKKFLYRNSESEYEELPDGYTRVEYIESTGTQYIDTGLVSTSNTRILTKLSWNNVTARQLIGADGGAYFGVVNNYWQIGDTGTNTSSIAAISNTWYDVEFTVIQNTSTTANLTLSVNGVSGTNTRSFSKSTPINLFALGRTNSSPTLYCNCKLGITYIYQNEILTRNLVPCKNSSGTIGMYDTITNTFYTNAGTGTFNVGPVVTKI